MDTGPGASRLSAPVGWWAPVSARGYRHTGHLSSLCSSHSHDALLQLNKTPSSSKKVTFGLNRNMTAGECRVCLQSPSAPGEEGPDPSRGRVGPHLPSGVARGGGGWGSGFLGSLEGADLVGGDVNGWMAYLPRIC